jgi:hypothetical protein
MNWAHIHLSLNHLPVVGIIFGVLLLLLALLRKSEELKRVSLGVFVLTALLALPVYFTGEPAEEVVEHVPGVAESLIGRHENAAVRIVDDRGHRDRRADRVDHLSQRKEIARLGYRRRAGPIARDQRVDGVDGQSRRADSPHGDSRRFHGADGD